MKARPRSVENQVADALNEHFKAFAVTPVERIPILGRTGPDISLNELGLVVDVKSRLEVPKSIFFPLMDVFQFDHFHAVRVANLNQFWDGPAFPDPPRLDVSSKMIIDYMEHMDEWTKANHSGAITCVVLHRPKLPIGHSVAIIYSSSRRRLYENANTYRLDRPGQ